MKKINTLVLTAIKLVCFFSLQSNAYSYPSSISYEQVLSIALENSPEIKRFAQEESYLRAEAQELNLLSNPEFSSEIRPSTNNTSSDDTEYELALTQPLRASNFGAREKVSELITKTADLESKMQIVTFEQDLLLAYSHVWILQEREVFLKKLLKYSDNLKKQTELASKGGLISESSKKLMLAGHMAYSFEQEQIASEMSAALMNLMRYVGAEIKASEFKELNFPDLPLPLEVDSQIPLVDKINLKYQIALERKNLSRLDSFPQFSPKIAFEHTAEGDDRVIAGISFDLPFFNRNQPERMKAEAALATESAKLKYLQDGLLQKEANLLADRVRSSQQQLNKLKNKIIPTIEEAYKASEKEVVLGQASPLQLWQVLNEMRDLNEKYLELWTKFVSIRAELSLLLGQRI